MNVNSQNETIEEEEFEQYHQSEPALPNSEDPSIVLGIDWDSGRSLGKEIHSLCNG